MAQLSKEDKKVVKWWWYRSEEQLFQKGYVLDKLSLFPKRPRVTWTSKSFIDILETGVTISASATRIDNRSPVSITVLRPKVIVGNVNEPGVRYHEVVHNCGSFEIRVSPIDKPPPRSWWRF